MTGRVLCPRSAVPKHNAADLLVTFAAIGTVGAGSLFVVFVALKTFGEPKHVDDHDHAQSILLASDFSLAVIEEEAWGHSTMPGHALALDR